MNNKVFWFAVALIVVLFSAWAIFAAIYLNSLSVDVGAYGVSFGIVNALFSGIAFAAFVWSLIRQQEQHQKTNAANQFFTLLKSWQNLISTAHYQNDVVGRAAIEACARDIMQARFGLNPDASRQEVLDNCVNGAIALYRNIDGSKDRIMGHYFRLLYHVVKHIDDTNAFTPKEKRQYVDIAVAHMSQSELRLFFYNCLTPKGVGFYKYAEEYEMFENFDVNALEEKKTLLVYPARFNQFANGGCLNQLNEADREIMLKHAPSYVAPIKRSTSLRKYTYPPTSTTRSVVVD